MRTFFVDRVYKPQVVMVCPKRQEMHRFAQKPKQIEFSRPHLKTMVLDAQEREAPTCPQDFEPLVVYRTPGGLPSRRAGTTRFICPNCLSYGQWIETGREEEDVAAAPKVKKEAPAFHDETIPLPKRMEMAKDGNLALKLYAAMAQTDCTACGYDCEGYAAALADRQGEGPEPLRARQGGDAKVVKDLLKGTGLPAASRLRLDASRLAPAATSTAAATTPSPSPAARAPDRDREGEAAPLPDDARGPDRPAVELDERAREREADAHAGVAARRRAVDLAETLEDVRQLALRDPDAVVLDADEVALGLALDAHDDRGRAAA